MPRVRKNCKITVGAWELVDKKEGRDNKLDWGNGKCEKRKRKSSLEDNETGKNYWKT